MSQIQTWKKRPAGLASEIKGQARSWLSPGTSSRHDAAAAENQMRKAAEVSRKK